MFPVRNLPQASRAGGSLAAILSAAGLYNAGSTRLSMNGAFNVIGRPFWHVGEAKAVKSPVSIAGVGTNTVFWIGVWRVIVPW